MSEKNGSTTHPKVSMLERMNHWLAMVKYHSLTPTEGMVLGYLLYRAGSGYAWPSYSTIAKDCNVSRSSAIRAVTKLDKLDVLDKESTDKVPSNVYAFIA